NGLAGEWDGTAHDSFQAVMATWQMDMSTIRTDLDAIAKDVKQAGVSYGDLEGAIQKAFTPR
ncbi:MAG: WXG100 family type VII secretion target, partial [Ktedonobacteraceae bacterium]